MQVVFRADASLQIGTGHLMRCLTLAAVLRSHGNDISFICRKSSGGLGGKIIDKGFRLFELEPVGKNESDEKLVHSNWLPVSQQQDADQCSKILKKIKPEWLIVDHYALDSEWESQLRHLTANLMVIDDLADRNHNCDLLLDQTFGRSAEDYLDLVPRHCALLTGSEYALLRSDFLEWRSYSIRRRRQGSFNRLLISMGGVDSGNHTETVLTRLTCCELPDDLNVTIVVGSGYSHLESLEMKADRLRCKVNIEVDVENMAEIMAQSDVAIGAAGTTSWERCCMGLPAIQIVLAGNQKYLAEKLSGVNASLLVDENNSLVSLIDSANDWMRDVSISAAEITDGMGAFKVAEALGCRGVKFNLKNCGELDLVNYIDLVDEDRAFVRKMRNHPAVNRWMYSQKEISEDEHNNFLKKIYGRKDQLYFLVKSRGTIVGCINFSQIVYDESVYFGIFANPYGVSKGAGRILEAAGVLYAARYLRVKVVKLEVFSDNTRALNFYHKCGFKGIESKIIQGKEVLLMEKYRDFFEDDI